MPPSRSTCAVIVVNFGSSTLLVENLVPLSRGILAVGADARCVVVDNFSTPAERNAVTRLADAEGWELLTPEENLGFGEGMNLGVARAAELGASRIVLLNPDAMLTVQGLSTLDEAVVAAPRTMFAPVVLRPDGRTWSAGSWLDLADGRVGGTRANHHAATTVPWLSGACLALSLELWTMVGGFADEYFLYWEDIELSYRVAAVGGALKVLDGVRVVHDVGGTQQTGPRRDRGKSASYYYYNIRNRLLFAARNLSTAELESWLRASPAVAREVMLRGGRQQFLRRPFSLANAYLRGSRDGRRIARERLHAGRVS